MIYVALTLLGLCFGSFINAFVWRLHEGKDWVRERSECVHCHHELAAKDLIPIFSWLMLRGKCRYCKKPISVQYPVVEALTALVFVGSYVHWPFIFEGWQVVSFFWWLALIVGLVALLIYDIRWMLLPNKLVFPLMAIAAVMACIAVVISTEPARTILDIVLAFLVGGGIFYLIFQISQGKWVGGGDVKLGFLLGLVVGTPAKALAVIFLAAILGSLVSLPLLMTKRLKRTSLIPFGPFLIVSGILVFMFGSQMIDWYTTSFLLGL